MFSVEFERKNPVRYAAIVDRAATRWAPLAGAEVRAQAVELSPWITGNLRGSITWKTGSADGGFGGENVTGSMIETPGDKYSAYVGTNVDYAEYIEYGASKFNTKFKTKETVRGYEGYKPYLRPALDVMRKKLNELLKRLVGEEVKRG